MTAIHVRQPHRVDRATARTKLEGFTELLDKYRVKLAWNGDKAKVKGVGVSGDVAIGDDAVDVTLKLGMLAKAAGIDASRLKASIAKRLTAAFDD